MTEAISSGRRRGDGDADNASCEASGTNASQRATESNATADPRAAKRPTRNESSLPPTSASTDANIAAAAANAKAASKGAGAGSNAARTTERDIREGLYAAAGPTHGGRGQFAGVALVKGSVPNGAELEIGSASIQNGRQKEAQAGVARFGRTFSHGNVRGSVSGEVLTASMHVGVDNSDGSVGLNAGATATVMSLEATASHSVNSVTAGLSAGAGAEGHIGARDQDGDGKPEICARLAVGPVILGICIEVPFVLTP